MTDVFEDIIGTLLQGVLFLLVLSFILGGVMLDCNCGDKTRALISGRTGTGESKIVINVADPDMPTALVQEPAPAEVKGETAAERRANCDMWRWELNLAHEQKDAERVHDLIDIRPEGCSPLPATTPHSEK